MLELYNYQRQQGNLQSDDIGHPQSVADLDILNRGVHLLILSQIYELKLKKKNLY